MTWAGFRGLQMAALESCFAMAIPFNVFLSSSELSSSSSSSFVRCPRAPSWSFSSTKIASEFSPFSASAFLNRSSKTGFSPVLSRERWLSSRRKSMTRRSETLTVFFTLLLLLSGCKHLTDSRTQKLATIYFPLSKRCGLMHPWSWQAWTTGGRRHWQSRYPHLWTQQTKANRWYHISFKKHAVIQKISVSDLLLCFSPFTKFMKVNCLLFTCKLPGWVCSRLSVDVYQKMVAYKMSDRQFLKLISVVLTLLSMGWNPSEKL